MHARAAAARATAAVLGTVALPLPVHDARADIAARPSLIAHRGASAYAPENTLDAVGDAASLGILWVENDVQRTKDGELVVIHDDSLRRTTDAEEVFPGCAPWKVKDFTAAEIARLDAGSWFDASYAGAHVARLPLRGIRLRRARAHRTARQADGGVCLDRRGRLDRSARRRLRRRRRHQAQARRGAAGLAGTEYQY